MRRTLLITGARVLAKVPDAAGWASSLLQGCIGALPKDAIVVTGDARGPDTWARNIALSSERVVIIYAKDGLRTSMVADGRSVRILERRPWTTPMPDPCTPEEWRAVALLRDRIMVAEVAAAHRMQKIEASIIALYAPDGWSKTHGTRYTAERARLAGLHVDGTTYAPGPATAPA